ncbi:MAG: type II toxin-antitoxin system death-on-curing family toxin [Firmicutes bacterium]|nr:type II toxin-antitoxin system death-on-curing family toxin [Bacillota bacterium]
MNRNIIYIPEELIEQIHSNTIDVSGGGDKGTIDIGRLKSVLTHIQNDDYYPNFVDKVTHLFFCVCKFHAFVDGNKRLAITLSAQFLILNGYGLICGKFIEEMENISYHVAANNISKDLLHEILESFLNGNYDSEEIKLKIFEAISKKELVGV